MKLLVINILGIDLDDDMKKAVFPLIALSIIFINVLLGWLKVSYTYLIMPKSTQSENRVRNTLDSVNKGAYDIFLFRVGDLIGLMSIFGVKMVPLDVDGKYMIADGCSEKMKSVLYQYGYTKPSLGVVQKNEWVERLKLGMRVRLKVVDNGKVEYVISNMLDDGDLEYIGKCGEI